MARRDNEGILGWPGDMLLSPHKRKKIQGSWGKNGRNNWQIYPAEPNANWKEKSWLVTLISEKKEENIERKWDEWKRNIKMWRETWLKYDQRKI